MRIDTLLLTPAVLSLFVTMVLSGLALAQSAGQACIQQGHKPGTAGFYRCLQEMGGSEGGGEGGGEAQSGEAESILGGSPDNAVTDYTGSTMSGATSPDPNILKQLNSPRSPK